MIRRHEPGWRDESLGVTDRGPSQLRTANPRTRPLCHCSCPQDCAFEPRRLLPRDVCGPALLRGAAFEVRIGLVGVLALRLGREGAVDGGLSDLGEMEVVVAGVSAQPVERFGHVDAGPLEDDPFSCSTRTRLSKAWDSCPLTLWVCAATPCCTTLMAARSAKARATRTSSSPIGV